MIRLALAIALLLAPSLAFGQQREHVGKVSKQQLAQLSSTGAGKKVTAGSGCSQYDTFYAAVTGGGEDLDTTHKDAYTALICGLQANSSISGTLWSRLDALWIFATGVTSGTEQDVAIMNIVNPGTYTISRVNSPGFTTDRGFNGNGSNSYLDTVVALNALTQFQQDSAHAGAGMITSTSTGGSYILFGSEDPLTSLTSVGPNIAGNLYPMANQPFAGFGFTSPANLKHNYLLVQEGTNVGITYLDGTVFGSTNTTSTGLRSPYSFYFFGRNQTGTLVFPPPNTWVISYGHLGAKYSAADVAAFDALIAAYMSAVGVP